MSHSDTAHETVGWQGVDQSTRIPLSQLAAEQPALLKVIKQRLVEDRGEASRAMMTHFGSAG